MAELGWLRSSPAKVPTNGSLSTGGTPSFNGASNENLYDLLQGRLGSSSGSGSIFGPSCSENASPFFRPSDHQQMNDDTDSTSLLKNDDENHLQPTVEQMSMGLQPNLWPVGDASASPLLGALGTHHHGLYNNAHIPGLHSAAAGMVIDSCQFPTFPSLKPHDPSPQLQALRDFMAYGNNNNVNAIGAGPQLHATPNLAAGALGGPPMFLHLGDESCSPGTSSLLQQLPGMPGGQMQRTFVGDNSSPNISSCKPDMMAYRALCQSDLFATERSPHRTQFQRENHILAERQRREEMNEKFSALRAMIPKATKVRSLISMNTKIPFHLLYMSTNMIIKLDVRSRAWIPLSDSLFKNQRSTPDTSFQPLRRSDWGCDRPMGNERIVFICFWFFCVVQSFQANLK